MLAVSVVVVNDDGSVLLRKREKDPDIGTWELFAGYPYLDEMPLEKAVKRILADKAGITEVDELQFSGKFYDDPERHPGQACVPLVFIASVSGKIESTENKKWFTATELRGLTMALDNKTTLIDLGLVK